MSRDGNRLRRNLALVALALVLVALASSGCIGPTVEAPGDALVALNELDVATPGSTSGYSRESFEHWSPANDFGWSAPQDSCNAREAALIRDGEDVQVGSGCKVTEGVWYDPYTTSTYTDPQEIDIDHVVPLAEAYRSGADSWSLSRRQEYANDPDVLLSVEDNANQEKSDQGPEDWKPPNEAEWCTYATRWVSIKTEYTLSVDTEEKSALEEMLGTCAAA